MINIKIADVVGWKEIECKDGRKLKLVYFMYEDKTVQGNVATGSMFVPSEKEIDLKKQIKVAYGKKGWDYVE